MWREGIALLSGVLAVALALSARNALASPIPPASDLPYFAVGGLGLALALLAAGLALGPRRPILWAAGAQAGLGGAILVLRFYDEPPAAFLDVVGHALAAPMLALFGFIVGFAHAWGPAAVGVGLLAGALAGHVAWMLVQARLTEAA